MSSRAPPLLPWSIAASVGKQAGVLARLRVEVRHDDRSGRSPSSTPLT
jgi:hypothetical protein